MLVAHQTPSQILNDDILPKSDKITSRKLFPDMKHTKGSNWEHHNPNSTNLCNIVSDLGHMAT